MCQFFSSKHCLDLIHCISVESVIFSQLYSVQLQGINLMAWLLYQFNFHCHCNSTSIVTNVCICLTFSRPNRSNHIARTLQIPWDYNLIPWSHGTIHLNISLTFTVTVIQLQLPQMDLYAFS